MSIDPHLIRSETHTEVGNLIQVHVTIILERWSRRAVQEQPQAPRVHHAVLLDHLRDFLQSLARSLAEPQEPQACPHCAAAARHGEQRWETGWSLPEVVRDYQILRLVVIEFLEETLDRPLGYREVLAIGLALDEAIAVSLDCYVRERDEAFHQLEAQRAEENRKAQQRLREQTAALQEADQRKNKFLAILAHELRNPLAPIRNVLQILRCKGTADAELHWGHELIERQVKHLAHMVDDLLDLARIASGKVKLDKEHVELATVVDRAVEMVRPLIEARKHQLAVSLPPQPIWLEADPPRLVQILANLLTNAAKYTNEGGQIELSGEPQAQDVVLSVRDTGIGMPKELLPRIFDLFAQGEHTRERTQDGLGIGLSLVRSLVDLHGGRVQAFSAGPGLGSTIVLHLPLAGEKSAPLAQAAKSARSDPACRRRILVVDDNLDAAQSLTLLLRLSGHEVYLAQDGPAALAAARSNVPEVVLLDIGLPGMDGLEVARRLRQEPGLKDTLLVALTGYGQEEDRRRSQEAGFHAHLLKPLELEELQELLKRFPVAESASPPPENG